MSEPIPPTPKAPSAPQADDLARQLKSALKERRPRPWLPVLSALVISIALLSLIVWWMYPRRTPDAMQVVALDGVFTPDETPSARAQLLLPNADDDVAHLGGQTIVFSEERLMTQPDAKPREVAVRSDAGGRASFDWPMPPRETMAEVLARYVNVAQRQMSLPDRARLFVWPKDAPLLVIDADETLIADKLDDDAQAALQAAGQDGWRIVFLCLAAADANDFRQARGWVQTQPGLPLGPVLGRSGYPSHEPLDQARRAALKSLRSRFRGPLDVVVKSADSALACKDLGVRTIVIGDADRPAGALHAPTWADVTALLK